MYLTAREVHKVNNQCVKYRSPIVLRAPIVKKLYTHAQNTREEEEATL